MNVSLPPVIRVKGVGRKRCITASETDHAVHMELADIKTLVPYWQAIPLKSFYMYMYCVIDVYHV